MESAAFDAWVEQARTVPIEDELARRGFHLRGKIERTGPCPVCGGDDRFSINTEKQVWNCRGCGKGGDVIDLARHIDGSDFTAACTNLAGEQPQAKPNGKANGKNHAAGEPEKIAAAKFGYEDEAGNLLFVVVRAEYQNPDGTFVATKDGKRKKTFHQRRPDPERQGKWIWNVDGVPIVPYRLPELLEAIGNGYFVVIAEGEGKVDLLRSWGIPATCCAGGAGKWKPEHSAFLRGADVVILPDNDEAGRKHRDVVGASLQGIAAWIRVLELPGLATKGDVRDWLAAGGTREQLDALVEQAPDWQPPPAEAPTDTNKDAPKDKTVDEQDLIDELARLNTVDYDRLRDAAADQLGVRHGTLDDAVAARRRELAEEAGPPPLFGHWVVEPWPEAVDTGALILALIGRVKRHVILSDDEALAVALWILFAWVHETAAVHSPILLVTSAEANSGKTTLISVVSFLVPRGLMTTGISEAALFRSIEKWLPTVIADEADVLLVDNDPLRAVINSGWTRGAGVLRCIGDDSTPHSFATFCPKIVGMKGRKLPDTTLSRSIIVEMRRKRPGDKAEHFRSIDDAGLAELRQRALRWANDNGEKLDGAEPDMPPGFDCRLGDNWYLLLAIADFAGGDWPDKARKAAVKLSKVVDTASTGQRLLADIKAAFEGVGPEVDRIGSADLVATLGANTESPWAEWKGGKPITQAQLARALKPFGIASEVVRLSEHATPRGYMRSQFEDAWERYL